MGTRLARFLIDAAISLLLVAAALLAFSRFRGAELVVGNLVLRSQGATDYPLAAPDTAALAAPRPTDRLLGPDEPLPKNVVLLIGDGMGVGVVSAASALLSPPGIPLKMETAPVVGLVHTWAADFLGTDSAAAATALATGFKTELKMIGITPDGREARNLFEAARAGGLATGLITTSGLADATPGGFLAHTASRDDFDLVLRGVLDSRIDVLIGGDFSGKAKAWGDRSYRRMVAAAAELGAERGYNVIRDARELVATPAPLLALLPPRPGMPIQHGPPLADSTARALDLIGAAPSGFLLVVESEVIDEAAHANDLAETMLGMRELEDAVARVLEWIAGRDDTLVLVLADHETGGPHLLEGEYASGRVAVRWAHNYHSSQLVPVFAFGPGAQHFGGVLDNTDIAPRLAALLGLEVLPRLAE